MHERIGRLVRTVPSGKLPDVLIVEPDVYDDPRGYFFESYRRDTYRERGIAAEFVQDNVSFSKRGVLRGLHYQLGRPQAKLITVPDGEIFDVAVDIRAGSPTFGVWEGFTLSSETCRQLFIPEGFAHGFLVVSETAIVHYKCSDYYAPEEERGIAWNDPTIAVDWPRPDPIVSGRDAALPSIAAIGRDQLPSFP